VTKHKQVLSAVLSLVVKVFVFTNQFTQFIEITSNVNLKLCQSWTSDSARCMIDLALNKLPRYSAASLPLLV